jgi:ATP-grasp in the biosynthetic pathway with Ter operon
MSREPSSTKARVWFNKCFSSVEGVLRQLRDDWGAGLFLIGSHSDGNFAPLAFCDLAETEPVGLSPEAYVDWCLGFCERNRVDAFIPGRLRDRIADRQADFEAAGTGLVVAGDGDTLRLLEDKGRFLSQLPDGVSVHSFHRVRTWMEFSDAAAEIEKSGHRVCFKPAVGTFGLGFHIIDDELTARTRLLGGDTHRISTAELLGILDTGEPFPELLVMEYLDGSEFSVDVLAHEGEVLAMVCRRKPFNGRVRVAGTSRMSRIREGQCQLLAREPVIEEMVRKLAEHFHLRGIFNVQFRSPAEIPEKPHLLEINGRMSGGLPYIGISGLNLALLAIRIALRKPGDPLPEIPVPKLPLRVREASEVFAEEDKI